jgi:hypothetical protein
MLFITSLSIYNGLIQMYELEKKMGTVECMMIFKSTLRIQKQQEHVV